MNYLQSKIPTHWFNIQKSIQISKRRIAYDIYLTSYIFKIAKTIQIGNVWIIGDV